MRLALFIQQEIGASRETMAQLISNRLPEAKIASFETWPFPAVAQIIVEVENPDTLKAWMDTKTELPRVKPGDLICWQDQE